jgi:hypothetical protein
MRLLGQSLFAASVIALSLMVAPACVDNDQSIYIRQVMIGTPGTGTALGCTYTADPSQPGLIAPGEVDVALRENYEAVLLVGNQMNSRGDNLQTRSESNKAHLDGAIVRVTDANGNDIAEFTAQSAGFADSANGTVAGFGLIGVTLLDAPTLAKIAGGLGPTDTKLVLANIKVFGETLGGDDLESGEFQWPITVCNGCLISFLGADDPLTPGVDCNLQSSAAGGAAGGGGSSTATLGCHPGQDGPVSCTVCRDTNPRCRSTQ